MAKALIQQAAGGVTDGGSLAFGSNVTAGSGLFALIAIPSATVTVSGITDTRGNTWSRVESHSLAGSTARTVEIWAAHNGSSGANTVTFDWSGAANVQLNISEWSGFTNGLTVDATDQADTSDALATSHNCGATGVLTTADSLALGILAIPTAFTVNSRSTGWNALTAGGARSDVQYKIATSAATEQATTGTTAGVRSVGAIASFSETAGGGTDYTLEAEAGSFSLTGTTASLEVGRRLTAASGSYALTGTAATLRRGYALQAESGSYALTGTAATLTVDRTLSAESATYSLTGTDATLRLGRSMAAEAGSYALTGTAASLRYNRVLSAESGSYAVTGTDATLTYTELGGYTLVAEAGAYALTGTAAALRHDRNLSAGVGSYSLTGAEATLRRGYSMPAGSGAYTVTGIAATLSRDYVLAAQSGSYVITGTAANLTYSAEEETRSSITLTGSYSPTVALTGSYVPSLSLTGSYRPSISLTGSIE